MATPQVQLSGTNSPHDSSAEFSTSSSSNIGLDREKDVQQTLDRPQSAISVHSQVIGAGLPQTSSEESGKDGDVEKVPVEKAPGHSMTDPSAFPDGGWEAWLVVLAAFFNMFVSFGWINCMSISFYCHYF